MDERLQAYIEEAYELLDNIEQSLIQLEGDPQNSAIIAKIFRSIHTIKGSGSFYDLQELVNFAHEVENVYDLIRDGQIVINEDLISLTLRSCDHIRAILDAGGVDREGGVGREILVQLAVFVPTGHDVQPETAAEVDETIGQQVDYRIEIRPHAEFFANGSNPLPLLAELRQLGPHQVVALGAADMPDLENLDPEICHIGWDMELQTDQGQGAIEDVFMFVDDICELKIEQIEKAAEVHDVAPPVASPPPRSPEPLAAKAEVVVDASLRVNVKLLDSLMNLAGELVLGRNQLLQSIAQDDIRAIGVASQRLDLITSEFQETIMLTRMQPVGNVFNKFPRVVRDLAKSLGKEIDIQLEGRDVELDKTIIEAIGDPLTHLVRNSADHGIETPEVRSRAGKDPKGTIVLKAYHEAGQVIIEIVDDGAGIDGARLVVKALERGLITEEQSRLMSEKEKIALIFMPGFSTAEKVSDVSGRGVGMDVVKTNLDSLGGQVDIESEVGRGTRIRIKLPLTLAIIPSQIISMGSQRYAIPQVNLEELVRIPANQVKDRIELVGDAQVVRLRGKLLPLVRLADILGVERHYTDPQTGEAQVDRRSRLADRRSRKDSQAMPLRDAEERLSQDRRYHSASAVNLMVVSTGAMQYGLVVDELHDSEEIVIKPLGRHFSNCSGYAGATIMGDGSVALILDVSGLAHLADLVSVEGSERAAELSLETARINEDAQSLLIFRCARDEQFCVPQALVQRIEKIRTGDIEQIGKQRVVQYREASLPLFSIDQVANVKPLAEGATALVIVFLIGGREVGLLASAPLDVVTVDHEFDQGTLVQKGIMGSAIIDGVTTQMVDIYSVVYELHPEWLEKHDVAVAAKHKILYAEDSSFFRTQVKSFIEDAGYHVLEACDGSIAWDLMQEHASEISMVVTDIEMPNMNGFELTEKIRSDKRFSGLPIIAMTTLTGQEDIERGRKAGIDDYQIKLDRERLLDSISQHLS